MRFATGRIGLIRFIVVVAFGLLIPTDARGVPPSFDIEVSNKGIEFESGGGKIKLDLGGRLQVDAAVHDSDASELDDDVDIRRARLALKGTLYGDWDFKVDADFRDGDADLKDLYLRYTGAGRSTITFGNFKEPFSIEEQTSSKHITFLERALPVDAFSPGRTLGIAWQRGTQRGSAAAGLFGEPISGSNDLDGQGFGFAARVTRAPKLSGDKVLHFGVAAEYREPRRGDRLRFDASPESALTDVDFVRTPRLRDVGHTMRYGLESAFTAGPVSLQGELILVDVSRSDGRPDVNLAGWYAYVSWFPTGETRPYKAQEGAFGHVKPRRRRGAWELALRFSKLDLDDADVDGGEEENITFGVSWYANANLRLMINYIAADAVRRGERDAPDILLLRAQLAF